jgi:hypothetical protein
LRTACRHLAVSLVLLAAVIGRGSGLAAGEEAWFPFDPKPDSFAESPIDAASPGRRLLRSWALPDGEPHALGEVDRKALGATSSAFEPGGRGWVYTKGNAVRWRPLPLVPGGPDHVLSVQREGVTLGTVGRSLLFSRDPSGEIHAWDSPGPWPGAARVLPRPLTAPASAMPEKRFQRTAAP